MKKYFRKIEQQFQTWLQKHSRQIELAQSHWLFLCPAALISLIGLSLFCWMSWPAMLTGLVVMMLGAVLFELSWRFVNFKNKVDRFLKDVEGRVIISGLALHENHQKEVLGEQQAPAKKILYH